MRAPGEAVGLLASGLADAGYTPEDIAAVLGGNWIEFIERVLSSK